jgi:hypothetical protein
MGSVPESHCYDVNLVENVRITALLGAEVLWRLIRRWMPPHNPHLMGVIDRQVWDNRTRSASDRDDPRRKGVAG